MNHAGETVPCGFPVIWMDAPADAGAHPGQRRLAIVGSHPEHRELIPFDDEAVEIWVFNEAPQKDWVRRWDVCFQLHTPDVYTSPNNYVRADHWDWLQSAHGKTIYMQAVDSRVPDSQEYPLESVLRLVPYRYLRSSPAMALALAIAQGYQQIDLYGVALTSNTEYAYQATNMVFWIGFAHGLGIDLRLHCWLDEFNQPIYGFEGELQIERTFFDTRAAELKESWRSFDQKLTKVKARIDQAMLERNFDRVAELSVDYEDTAMTAGELAGALGEAERYASRETPIPRQEFEFASAKAQQEGEELRVKMYHTGGKAEYVWNVWKQTGHLQALNQLRLFLKEKGEHAYNTGARLGIHRENLRYLAEYDTRVTAAGGVRALTAVQHG